jgi:uncharacterized lipoprotein YbaY
VGRLDDIIARNKEPGKHSKGGRVPMSMLLSIFVVVILFLVIFTDLDETPRDAQPQQPAPAATDKKRVDGVLLYREKSAPRDAGVTVGRD